MLSLMFHAVMKVAEHCRKIHSFCVSKILIFFSILNNIAVFALKSCLKFKSGSKIHYVVSTLHQILPIHYNKKIFLT